MPLPSPRRSGSTRTTASARAIAPAALLSLLALAGPAATAASATAEERGTPTAARQVVITIDDLPKVSGQDDLETTTRVTESIVAAIERHQVPALGFVIGRQVFHRDQVDARLDLLRRWLAAGADLANHSFSHPAFNTTALAAYQDDVVRGSLAPRLLMEEAGREMRYFRHPYNQTGPDAATRDAFRAFMARRDVLIAPFTVEHADYLFNRLWVEAGARGDQQEAGRIRAAYMEYLDTAFEFAEELARDTFDEPIPQVFLIHANQLNALCLDAMLRHLAERGYEFITMDRAMRHPAYATPDEYVGTNGISWLHRWRRGLGLPDRLKDEPDPPMWLLKAWRESQERSTGN